MKPSAPVSSSLTNRPARVTPATAAEGGADAVGEEMGDQPVDGFALGRHGAALGGGDAGRDLGERFRRRVGQPAVAEPRARISARWTIRSA